MQKNESFIDLSSIVYLIQTEREASQYLFPLVKILHQSLNLQISLYYLDKFLDILHKN